jgi:hypothetical protein
VHIHGHVAGPSPYSLILLGDNMLVFEREEYDPTQGTWRTLVPGDPGQPNRRPARDWQPDPADAPVTIMTLRCHATRASA